MQAFPKGFIASLTPRKSNVVLSGGALNGVNSNNMVSWVLKVSTMSYKLINGKNTAVPSVE